MVVCDLATLREMLSMEAFSSRGSPRVFGINIFALLKDGHGGHGLMFNEGMRICLGWAWLPIYELCILEHGDRAPPANR